jgi:hypothetical protein
MAGTHFAINAPLNYPSVTTAGMKGLLSGTVTFATVIGVGDASGTMEWVKPQQSKGAYAAAFDTQLSLIASFYISPGATGSVLPNFTAGNLVLTDTGTLSVSGSGPLDKVVALSTINTIDVGNHGADRLYMTITPSNGVFTGRFMYPGTVPKPTIFWGVMFQDQTIGSGFFLGPNGSGTVILSP